MSTRRAVSMRRFKEQKELEQPDEHFQAGQGRSCDRERKSSDKTPAKTPTRSRARSTPINDRESIKTEQLNKIIEKHREEQRKRKGKEEEKKHLELNKKEEENRREARRLARQEAREQQTPLTSKVTTERTMLTSKEVQTTTTGKGASKKTAPKFELTTMYDRDQSGSQESVSQEDDKIPSTLDLDLHLSESEYIPTSPRQIGEILGAPEDLQRLLPLPEIQQSTLDKYLQSTGEANYSQNKSQEVSPSETTGGSIPCAQPPSTIKHKLDIRDLRRDSTASILEITPTQTPAESPTKEDSSSSFDPDNIDLDETTVDKAREAIDKEFHLCMVIGQNLQTKGKNLKKSMKNFMKS